MVFCMPCNKSYIDQGHLVNLTGIGLDLFCMFTALNWVQLCYDHTQKKIWPIQPSWSHVWVITIHILLYNNDVDDCFVLVILVWCLNYRKDSWMDISYNIYFKTFSQENSMKLTISASVDCEAITEEFLHITPNNPPGVSFYRNAICPVWIPLVFKVHVWTPLTHVLFFLLNLDISF